MGRKRIGQNKDKRIISISIDRKLLHEFDNTLGDYTRSGRIEKLIIQYFKGSQTKISGFERYSYECEDCYRGFHINRHVDPIVLSCNTKKGGCGSLNIVYCGILGEEE